jgi:glycosyltransferase involved in cell wall biosynthesis
MKTSISFVVSAYNEQANIGLCVNSIQRALRSHNVIGEIIVVDNGSTDDTAKIARIHGAIVVNQPIRGLTHARTAGQRAAHYDLVAHVDADNVVPSGWLGTVLDTMHDPSVVACSGPLYYDGLSVHKRVITEIFYVFARVVHKLFPMIQGGNFVMRRSAYDTMGGFDTTITFYGDDTDIAVRLAKVGKIKFVPAMWINSSPRRVQAEGLVTTGVRYIANYFSVHLLGKPWSEMHNDIRPK